jgi:feruloyl esterase
MNACAGKDGGLPEDRFLSAPDRCRFNPKTLQCKRNVTDESQCLTREEVEAVEAIYRGAHNPRTHARLYYGWPKGSELGWPAYWANPARPGEPARLNFWRYWIFHDPDWTADRFDFDRDVARLDEASPAIDAVNPDLSAFAKAGGKLIQFHGLADPVVPPDDSITYYERVRVKDSDPSTFFRLFMVPGLGHCQGGPGLTSVATQDALERWVEGDDAPATLLATRFKSTNPADGAVFTRPVCPYPAEAVYDGKGDRMTASSFRCKAPKP